jgi:integrase
MLLSLYLTDVYAPLRGLGARSISLYQYTIAAFSDFIGHAATVGDLEELAVARFLAARLAGKAAATVAKDRAQLHALWQMAARRGLSKTWPEIRRVRVPERVPEAWMADEVRRLIDAASQERGMIEGVPAGDFWNALVRLLYETGERVSAVMSVEWNDIKADSVLYRAETRKGQTRDILRTITPSCSAALESIRRPRRLVFAWPLSKSMLWYRMGRICKRAGLPHDRRSKFHRIRRTTASHYAAAGGDAQRLLDHSSPAVTKRYLDPRILQEIRASDVLPFMG